MLQLEQTRNLSDMRYSALLQDMGTKKPVTQPRPERHKCEMKKKGVEKNPKPNSIFGLGSDLASFNLELFAYSDQWDHYSLRLRHKAALVAFGAKPQRYLHLLSADSGNRSESSSFGAFQLFFPWLSVPDSLISGSTIY